MSSDLLIMISRICLLLAGFMLVCWLSKFRKVKWTGAALILGSLFCWSGFATGEMTSWMTPGEDVAYKGPSVLNTVYNKETEQYELIEANPKLQLPQKKLPSTTMRPW